MIIGHVTSRRALLPIIFRLPNQPDLTIEFVVDTGFTEFLTLPLTAVSTMKLPFLLRSPMVLADGSTVELDFHLAIIIWQGSERQVPILATGRRPLIGTSLLDGHELRVQFIEGGLVTIDTF